MKYVDEFRNAEAARALIDRIQRRKLPHPTNLMEVCGTHTVSIFKHGIRQLLPDNITMLSGPGCPVCVTPNADIDRAIAIAQQPRVIFTTFGDMMKVPGSYSSLQIAKSEGADIRVVYSPLDVLKLVQNHPDRQVIFFSVGFETTAPAGAATILEAQRLGLRNLSFLSVHKLIPPAMEALLASGEVRIDGFMCPGHVSTIIGSRPYEFIPREFGIPCVIAGFEPLDILQAIDMLLEQVVEGRAEVGIQYRRAVRTEGNPVAQQHMEQVFTVCDASWRGIGIIPKSGLSLREEYQEFDATKAIEVSPGPTIEAAGCRCGEVLRGVCTPPDCPLFGGKCRPEQPIGPCMVSTEGTCSTWYLYS